MASPDYETKADAAPSETRIVSWAAADESVKAFKEAGLELARLVSEYQTKYSESLKEGSLLTTLNDDTTKAIEAFVAAVEPLKDDSVRGKAISQAMAAAGTMAGALSRFAGDVASFDERHELSTKLGAQLGSAQDRASATLAIAQEQIKGLQARATEGREVVERAVGSARQSAMEAMSVVHKALGEVVTNTRAYADRYITSVQEGNIVETLVADVEAARTQVRTAMKPLRGADNTGFQGAALKAAFAALDTASGILVRAGKDAIEFDSKHDVSAKLATAVVAVEDKARTTVTNARTQLDKFAKIADEHTAAMAARTEAIRAAARVRLEHAQATLSALAEQLRSHTDRYAASAKDGTLLALLQEDANAALEQLQAAGKALTSEELRSSAVDAALAAASQAGAVVARVTRDAASIDASAIAKNLTKEKLMENVAAAQAAAQSAVAATRVQLEDLRVRVDARASALAGDIAWARAHAQAALRNLQASLAGIVNELQGYATKYAASAKEGKVVATLTADAAQITEQIRKVLQPLTEGVATLAPPSVVTAATTSVAKAQEFLNHIVEEANKFDETHSISLRMATAISDARQQAEVAASAAATQLTSLRADLEVYAKAAAGAATTTLSTASKVVGLEPQFQVVYDALVAAGTRLRELLTVESASSAWETARTRLAKSLADLSTTASKLRTAAPAAAEASAAAANKALASAQEAFSGLVDTAKVTALSEGARDMFQAAQTRASSALAIASEHIESLRATLATHMGPITGVARDHAIAAATAGISTTVAIEKKLRLADKAAAIDARLGVTETASASLERAVELDAQYKVREKAAAVATTAQALDERVTGGLGTKAVKLGTDAVAQGLKWVASEYAAARETVDGAGAAASSGEEAEEAED